LLSERAELLGLLGPRELDRLWERHLINSAAVAGLLPPSGLVIDVGSGAGLPGVVLALMRPDLEFELVDSMRRRTDWLSEATQCLGLANVAVTWARAEELRGRAASCTVSRAVARLDKLARWQGGLLAAGGRFLAMKGVGAAGELADCGRDLARAGLVGAKVVELIPVAGLSPTYVVKARKRAARG
jgi:16S rRNA (guanine527-N7)-methyltransferase